MIFGSNRDALRQQWFDVYAKMMAGSVLTPLEAQLRDVLTVHPEYHAVLAAPDKHADKDYSPESGETNPFLHMALHVALMEQLSTNRPAGIPALYQQALMRTGDRHQAEHLMLEALAEMMWRAQRYGKQPSESEYLQLLREFIVRKH